ncbi:MAG: hypothetical protein MRY83_06370 [Flavobacteriales bacterium]|nr:hypothetical protein [Flavobacteriales bacterium]
MKIKLLEVGFKIIAAGFLVLLFYFTGFVPRMSLNVPEVRIDTIEVNSDMYKVFHLDSFGIETRLERPSASSEVALCVPAAYTNLADNSVDGLFCSDSKLFNANKINSSLKGVFMNINDSCFIRKVNRVSLAELISEELPNLKYAFQQTCLVSNHSPEKFQDNNKFQRRALVEFSNGKWAIVENESSITMNEFAKQLAALGTRNAIYMDMGAWDEGWVKTMRGRLILGKFKTQTKRQSNWLVYTRK